MMSTKLAVSVFADKDDIQIIREVRDLEPHKENMLKKNIYSPMDIMATFHNRHVQHSERTFSNLQFHII